MEISIQEKHPHTNKEEVYRYKVTARDVFILSTIWYVGWAYELLMIFWMFSSIQLLSDTKGILFL